MSNDEQDVGGEVETNNKTDLIRKAIKLFEGKLNEDKLKVSASEYIRLLELLQQIDGDIPREIKVTWVEQSETESSSEK